MPYRWTLTDLIAPYVGSEILTKDPIGWDEAVINVARSEQYKGMNTFYTNSLKFHCNGGGKEYIDSIYESEGIDGRINILIEYDCDGSGTYDILFDGIVNLASYKTDGEYTTCNIEQSDLHTKLAMRDEISVDLESTTSIGGVPITAPSQANLTMHSQRIFLKSAMDSNAFTEDVITSVANSVLFRGFVMNQLQTNISEAQQWTGWNTYSDIALNGPTASTSLLPEIFEANDSNVRYPATYTYRAHFSGNFSDIINSIQTRVNGAHNLVLAYGQTLATATTVALYNSTGYSGSATTLTIAFDTTSVSSDIILNFGDKVWLYWFESETITTGPYVDTITYRYDYDVCEFSIEIDSETDKSICKSFYVHEAFNQISDAIADGDGHFVSDFYGRTNSQKVNYDSDGCGAPLVVTNGLNIRQFPNTPIAISFKEMFNAFDCIHNIGMAIENNNIRVEPLSYWFDSTTKIVSLPNVKSYEQNCDNKRFINKIDIGYQKWESEFKGGLDEPNTKHEYSTIVSSVKNSLNKLCSFIASGYTIEFTRRKAYTDEKTTDWRFDNDNFVVAVKSLFYGEIVFTAANTIRLTGLYNNIEVGDSLIILGTGLNDGTFTVATVSLIINRTVITVVEAITTETVTATINDVTNPFCTSELYPDSFSYGNGMASLTTAYNLRLTPARMLLSHFNVIAAGIQLMRGAIKFVKGEGNTSLSVAKDIIAYTDQCQEDYSSQLLSENQSFQWNDSNVKNVLPLWLPETYSFEYPLTYSEFKAIKANPYGYIEFYKFANDVKQGFIMSMEYKIKTGLTKFELLRKY